VDDPGLDIDETCVMVLKNVGPVGYPGMPEVGNMALPKKLLEKGVTDMVRISDGRMSGTAYGTVVLHVSPESAIGGRAGAGEGMGTGSSWMWKAGGCTWMCPEEELERRRAAWKPAAAVADRGYVQLFIRQHVQQADKGADLDFLRWGSGSEVSRDSH
jgi:L-arabonate dehydrase